MAITAKPFSWAQKIKRVIFKGRPAYFNAIDFNKELEVIHNAMDESSRLLGVESTVVISVTNITHESSGGDDTNSFDLSYSDGYVAYKGVRFNLLATTFSTFTDTFTTPTGSPLPLPKAYYIILTADLVTETFGTSPSLCGIQSSEYPTLVPSCEVLNYKNVSITITEDPSSQSNFICILGTVTPRVDPVTSELVYEYFSNTYTPEDLNFLGSSAYDDGTFQSNKSIIEKLNFQDKRYAKIFEPNYFENTQNIKANLSGATWNTATKKATLGAGNYHYVSMGSDNILKGFIPHSSYRDYGILYITLDYTGQLNTVAFGAGGEFVGGSSAYSNNGETITVFGITVAPGVIVWQIAGVGINAHNYLAGLIASEVSNRTTAISTEATARTNGDAAVTAAYIAADAVLSSAINERVVSVGATLAIAKLTIGNWDMNATQIFDVTHGFSDWKKIRSVAVTIRNDADDLWFDLCSANVTSGNSSGSVYQITPTLIRLCRTDGGLFDNVTFDVAPSGNRGYIMVTYEL